MSIKLVFLYIYPHDINQCGKPISVMIFSVILLVCTDAIIWTAGTRGLCAAGAAALLRPARSGASLGPAAVAIPRAFPWATRRSGTLHTFTATSWPPVSWPTRTGWPYLSTTPHAPAATGADDRSLRRARRSPRTRSPRRHPRPASLPIHSNRCLSPSPRSRGAPRLLLHPNPVTLLPKAPNNNSSSHRQHHSSHRRRPHLLLSRPRDTDRCRRDSPHRTPRIPHNNNNNSSSSSNNRRISVFLLLLLLR